MSNVQEILQVASFQMEAPEMVPAIAAAAAVAGALVVGRVMAKRFDGTRDELASGFNDQHLLEETYTEVASSVKRPDQLERKNRIGLAQQVVAVGGVAAAAWFANTATYEATYQDESAQAVIVQDVSSSMLHTEDMAERETRQAAVVGALDDLAGHYGGQLANVQTATGAKTTLNFAGDWATRVPEFTEPVLDPNGGDLLDGVNAAADLLPIDGEGKREGTMIIMSDGTINDSGKAVNETLKKLVKDGVTVQAIIPGTPDGSYNLGGGETNSAVQPDVFASLDEEHVVTADSREEIQEALDTQVTAQSTIHERRTSYLIPGALTAAFAFMTGKLVMGMAGRKITGKGL